MRNGQKRIDSKKDFMLSSIEDKIAAYKNWLYYIIWIKLILTWKLSFNVLIAMIENWLKEFTGSKSSHFILYWEWDGSII